jgi:hypothetical protein
MPTAYLEWPILDWVCITQFAQCRIQVRSDRLTMEGLLLGSLCMGLGGAFGRQALPTANLGGTAKVAS